MKQALKKFIASHLKTKIFIFTAIIYLSIIIWTTIQAFLRVEFNRTGVNHNQILIISQPEGKK